MKDHLPWLSGDAVGRRGYAQENIAAVRITPAAITTRHFAFLNRKGEVRAVMTATQLWTVAHHLVLYHQVTNQSMILEECVSSCNSCTIVKRHYNTVFIIIWGEW